MSRRHTGSFHAHASALCAVVVGLALILSACSGDAADDDASAGEDRAYVEPEYDGLPVDLTSDEVCELLDEPTVADMLSAEISKVTPGASQPDCTWMYKLPGGPATTLQVQVMSMSQTSDLLGTEALEWGLSRAPQDSQIIEVDSLEVPNGSYEFGSSTVVFAIDPAGRLFTVAAHSDTPEQGRLALVEAVLTALSQNHS